MNEGHATDPVDLLNRLLEAERAGVKVLGALIPGIADPAVQAMAKRFLRDEGMNCQILKTMIENAGAPVSQRTGDFVGKIEALPTLGEKLELLVKGQEWVAKQIRRSRAPGMKVSDRFLLESIRIQHEENVDALKDLLSPSR
ncbi:MAG TPA: DUF6306 domain-containing protein [Candidatus Ozemobacteraceae bacterium]|nr:DUF6306 domain-containing protein [Candidatus Ozemobacteraceae bacterium]